MSWRSVHRFSAIAVGLFVSIHLVNHLVALDGVAAHLAFMKAARQVYRFPPIEFLLLAFVALQACTGLWLFIRGWKSRRGAIAWLQALAGAYIAFFVLIHVGAVWYGRSVLHLDTNFYFAAAGFHVPPFGLFFGPYYFTAVLALFVHLGCMAYRRAHALTPQARALTVAVPAALGGVMAMLIVSLLAGWIHPVDIPLKYKAVYLHSPAA